MSGGRLGLILLIRGESCIATSCPRFSPRSIVSRAFFTSTLMHLTIFIFDFSPKREFGLDLTLRLQVPVPLTRSSMSLVDAHLCLSSGIRENIIIYIQLFIFMLADSAVHLVAFSGSPRCRAPSTCLDRRRGLLLTVPP